MPLILSGDTGPSFVQSAAISSVSASAMPAGSVIQTLNAISPYNTNITVTNSSTGQSALYNTGVPSRVYGDLVSITVTPTFSNSKFLVFGTAGGSAGNAGANGAYGIVLVVDNSTGIGFGGDFPYYPIFSSIGNAYVPDVSMNAYYTPGSAAAFTVYLKGYSYSEGSNQITRFRNAVLIIQEIKQ